MTAKTKTAGRPPLLGKALPNPHNVRYPPDVMETARQIARERFDGNLSHALRYLVDLGRQRYLDGKQS